MCACAVTDHCWTIDCTIASRLNCVINATLEIVSTHIDEGINLINRIDVGLRSLGCLLVRNVACGCVWKVDFCSFFLG